MAKKRKFDNIRPLIQVDEYVRKAEFVRAVDGDTIDVDISQGWGDRKEERLRLLDVDTPEVRGAEKVLGKAYTLLADWWIRKHGQTDEDGKIWIWIRSVKWRKGKYGRTLAEIYSWDRTLQLNTYLNEKMIQGWTGEMQDG